MKQCIDYDAEFQEFCRERYPEWVIALAEAEIRDRKELEDIAAATMILRREARGSNPLASLISCLRFLR